MGASSIPSSKELSIKSNQYHMVTTVSILRESQVTCTTVVAQREYLVPFKLRRPHLILVQKCVCLTTLIS